MKNVAKYSAKGYHTGVPMAEGLSRGQKALYWSAHSLFAREMNIHFQQAVDSLHPKYEALMSMVPVHLDALPRRMPKRGVYLLSEQDRHLYAGRSNCLRTRLRNHVRDSHHTATLAFLMARIHTTKIQPSYRPHGSRADLLCEPEFRAAFDAARDRMRVMDIRYVEEADPVRQALLEIYVALASAAKYNSFDNH